MIITEGILFVETAIELYTGELTYADLIMLVTLCLILALLIHMIIMRKKRKCRGNIDVPRTKRNNQTDDMMQD